MIAMVSRLSWLLVGLSTASALRITASPKMNANVHPSTLPGDPSLILNTNVKISEKLEFMKAASKIIATTLSKPETYVAVCVNDDLDIIWAGEDTPCALGMLCSLGQINMVRSNTHGQQSELATLHLHALAQANSASLRHFICTSSHRKTMAL